MRAKNNGFNFLRGTAINLKEKGVSKPPGSSRRIRRPQHCGLRAGPAAALPGLGDATLAGSLALAQASHVLPVPGRWSTWVCNMCASVHAIPCPGHRPGKEEFPRLQPQVMGREGRQEGKFLPRFQGDGKRWKWGQSCLCQRHAGSWHSPPSILTSVFPMDPVVNALAQWRLSPGPLIPHPMVLQHPWSPSSSILRGQNPPPSRAA